MAEGGNAAGVCEVLYGHRVSDSVDREALGPDRINTIRPAELRHLLEHRREWISINPEDFSSEQLSNQGGAPRYLLTFDDGYRDNLTAALPVVEAAGVPILIFITTGFVDGRRLATVRALAQIISSVSELRTPEGHVMPCAESVAKQRVYQRLATKLRRKGGLNRDNYIDELTAINSISNLETDREFLSWEEVRVLDRHPLVTIGAHSLSHPCLISMRPTDAFQEIIGSKIELERRLGHSIDYFAYPYGSRNLMVDWLVRRAGFRLGFITEPRFLSTPWPLSRYRIPRIDLMKVVAENETLAV